MHRPQDIHFAFFGTSHISVLVLDELKKKGFIPSVIVTTEDKPAGRKMVLTPPETKVWAQQNSVPIIQLKTLRTEEAEKAIRAYEKEGFDLFLVASYGKIIPQNILDIPKHGSLNVHPSLLPLLRGPSPLQSAILSLPETGVTIMKVDNEMDHGPILLQQKLHIEWPPYERDLENAAGTLGGEMLANLLIPYIEGKVTETEQNHTEATVCAKIQKVDGELNLLDDPEKNVRKVRAFHRWPTAYYFLEHKGKKIRIIVTRARVEDGKFVIEKIIPEGKKEMNYEDYMRNIN